MDTIDNVADEAQTTAKAGLARRTVMAGAAWTIPVVALASAIPAAAATGATPPQTNSWSQLAWGWAYGGSSGGNGGNGGNGGGPGGGNGGNGGNGGGSGTNAYAIGAHPNRVPFYSVSSTVPGVTTTITSLSFTVRQPFAVTWTNVPAGWTVQLVSSSATSGFTYAFTPPASFYSTPMQVNSPLGATSPYGLVIPTFEGVITGTSNSMFAPVVTVNISRVDDLSNASGGPYSPSTKTVSGPITYTMV